MTVEFRADERTDAEKKIQLPAIDCDLLAGVDGIAAWFGWPHGRAKDLVKRGIVPTFTIPSGKMRFGFKSEISAAFRAYAELPGARTPVCKGKDRSS